MMSSLAAQLPTMGFEIAVHHMRAHLASRIDRVSQTAVFETSAFARWRWN
jgi:hypothetical protein